MCNERDAPGKRLLCLQAAAAKTLKFTVTAIIITRKDLYRIPYWSAALSTLHK
jgi:hypothetical protein